MAQRDPDPLPARGPGRPGGSDPLPRSATRAARGAAPPAQQTDWAQIGRGGGKRVARAPTTRRGCCQSQLLSLVRGLRCSAVAAAAAGWLGTARDRSRPLETARDRPRPSRSTEIGRDRCGQTGAAEYLESPVKFHVNASCFASEQLGDVCWEPRSVHEMTKVHDRSGSAGRDVFVYLTYLLRCVIL